MKKFIIAASAWFFTWMAPPVRQNLIFDYTAENADCLTVYGKNMLRNYNSIGKCCNYSAIRSTEQARTGRYSIRYELNKTDKDVYGKAKQNLNAAS